MMYAKLVLRNIKRSFGDYTIYLLTLCFAVAIFYIFNAIPFSDGVQSSSKLIREAMPIFMNALSGFIIVILGFLIVYANNFITKKRNKELGIYMLLGMPARKISVMLFLETSVFAIIALLIGLFAGIFLSQGMTFVVANIFKQELKALKFSVSVSSLGKTVIFFLVMFVIVAAISSYKIACLRIINLLQAGKKNERIRFNKPGTSITLFVFSVIFLAAAYIIALGKGFRFNDVKQVIPAFIFGSIGTYLFYFSASGFILAMLAKNKKLYYKKLNIFSLRQVGNKITTNTVLIATISIMLLVTVCSFAGGFGLNDFANNKLKRISPNDFEFSTGINTNIAPICGFIKAQGYDKYSLTEIAVYPSDAALSDTVLKHGLETISKESANAYRNLINTKLKLIRLTDYNNLRKQKGFSSINLDKGTIALHVIESELKPYVKDFSDTNKTLLINGAAPKIAGVYDENLVAGYLEFAVINDEELAASVPDYKVVTIDINGKYDEAFSKKVTTEINKYKKGSLVARFDNLQKLYGVSALAIFAGLYIGITFLVMSTAILALQQLTDATQHRQRYETLKKIGADNKMLDRSILIQMVIYFFAPMLLTIVNGAVSLAAITNYIQIAGNFSIIKTILFTIIVFAVFYVLYFTACNRGFKRILLGQGH